MNDVTGATAPDRGGERVSRRAAVLELAGIAAVLAVPAGVVLATAKPIPNAPNRKVLNFAPLANQIDVQRERAAEKETQRANKKKREERESRSAASEEEQPASGTE
jgi:hypothetical protein